jgi:hypothetical protein
LVGVGAGTSRDRPFRAGGAVFLGGAERLGGDDRLMDGFAAPDPVGAVVPAHLGFVAECDVVDADEYLVASLAVPDLPAGVAGVREDDAHGGLSPCALAAGSVAVACGVGCGWGENAVSGESFGDGVDAAPGQVFGEDATHDRRGGRVDLELVRALAGCGFAGVGVGADVGEPVAVWGAAAEEATVGGGLGRHRGANAYFDSSPFGLSHRSEDAHHELITLGVGIDTSAGDVGQPQPDPVVLEEREGEFVLRAVERACGFADDDRFEAACRILERVEQPCRLRSALPRQRSGETDIEELFDDRSSERLDELVGASDLPAARRLGILLIFGTDPSVEREAHAQDAIAVVSSRP